MVPEKIKAVMTRYPFTVSPQSTIREALQTMDRYDIRHIPVTESEKVIGVLSEREIRRFESVMDADKVAARDVMVSNPYFVTHGTPLVEVVKVMQSKKIGSAVITKNNGEILGIFTTTDALRILAELLEAEDKKSEVMKMRSIENYLSMTV